MFRLCWEFEGKLRHLATLCHPSSRRFYAVPALETPAATIERIRAELEAERTTEAYARRKEADVHCRNKTHAENFFGWAVSSLSSDRTTPALVSEWQEPSLTMQPRSEVARSPEQSESRSRNERKLP
jgi:hypothetical protein